MQIQVRYTESLIKRATMRFWLRFIAWHGFAVVVLMSVCLLYLLMIGDHSWYVSVGATVLALAVLMGPSVYFVYRNRSLATFRRMAEPTVTMNFSDAGISTQSDLGGGNLAWRGITQVWTFPEVWLVFIAKWHYFTIPTESLSDEVRQFIKQKVQEHGGKVR
jgi:hypothetical protein